MRILAAGALLAVFASAADPLLFSFFRNNGEDGLYLAAGDDGLKWRVLHGNQPLLRPLVGENKLMRDPSIAQGPDGVYHMVWTTSWKGRTIGYASSKDLLHWSEQRAIPLAFADGVLNCWAPEVFYDAKSKEFVVVWASIVKGRFTETIGKGGGENNHRLYAFRTKDFKRISEPKLFYDPGFQVIDGAVFQEGKRYVMVAKNETLQPPAKYLFLTFADSLDGPWSRAGESISGPRWAEGPTPVRVGGYWHIYFDKYRDKHYGVIRSKDLVHWEDLTDKLAFPEGARHGTAFHAPRQTIEAIGN